MHPRYTRPVMKDLWSEENKFKHWLKVELAYLRARADAGQLPRTAYEAISKHASFSVERINALEAKYRHDMIAFVVTVQESLHAAGVGRYAHEFHRHLTSYDVEDPAVVLLLDSASAAILINLDGLTDALKAVALAHRDTLMIARTHGQYAEPDSFGRLLLVFREQIVRQRNYLHATQVAMLSEGRIAGAVGTSSGIDPDTATRALMLLGLGEAAASTQILQRDRHAAVINAIALCGCAIEQMCRTFWEMMRSDVGELEEPRGGKQRGSSRMAYKKNPISTEQLQGLARLLRAYALAAMENVATPEHRDISQSSVERHVFPGATSLLHYMAHKATQLVSGLVVKADRMAANLSKSKGVWAGQAIREALMDHGVDYDSAYEYVQQAGFMVRETDISMQDAVSLLPVPGKDGLSATRIIGAERMQSFFHAHELIKSGVNLAFAGLE